MSVFIKADEIELPVTFIDTRFNLQNIDDGKLQYDLGHIEGAVYFDLNKDLSDLTNCEGRHAMPSQESLVDLFERSGLQLDDQIIIYDQGPMPFASRAWFLLYYAGFSNIRIVSGGFDALVAAGFPVSKEVPIIQRTSIQPNWRTNVVALREDVKETSDGHKRNILIDARSYKRYIGEMEPLDSIAGHIPSAQNFDWEQLIDGQSISYTDDLVKRFAKDQSYIVYCGSGVTAAPVYTSLIHEGYEHVQLYVGGYSDWIRTFPVATGDETK